VPASEGKIFNNAAQAWNQTFYCHPALISLRRFRISPAIAGLAIAKRNLRTPRSPMSTAGPRR
jgi:hypothetical protein